MSDRRLNQISSAALKQQLERRTQMYHECATENMLAVLGVSETIKRLKASVAFLEEFND